MARRTSASPHMPLLLLLGGGVAALLYSQNKKQAALRALSTVPPVAASRTVGQPQDQLTQDLNAIDALAPQPLNGLQRSSALPGMGSFHLSHVFNNVVAKPISQIASGPLKVPLAIMTLGQSALLAKGVQVANAGVTAMLSTISDPVLKARQMVMGVVDGKASAPAPAAGVTTVTYLDCNGSVIDLPTIQNQLAAVAAAGGATSITPTIDAAGNATYRMPACPPAAGTYAPYTGGNPVPITATPVTGAPSVATGTQINPATGLAYPIGTPISPYTGQAYINPATGQPWPPYTTIDPTTGMPPVSSAATSYPTSSGSGYDGSGSGYSYTDPNVVNQASTSIDPTTGLPYAQQAIDPTTGLPYPAAPTTPTTPAVVPAAVAPAPSKVSWLTVAGIALAVPAIMYATHK